MWNNKNKARRERSVVKRAGAGRTEYGICEVITKWGAKNKTGEENPHLQYLLSFFALPVPYVTKSYVLLAVLVLAVAMTTIENSIRWLQTRQLVDVTL
jgi:hypothetical protein